VFPDVDLLRNYHFGPSVSGVQALASKLNPFARHASAPFMFESLVRVLALNGVYQAKTQRGFADVYIRPPVEQYNLMDFGAYKQIAEIGYRSAVEALREWKPAPQGIATDEGSRRAGDVEVPAARKGAVGALHDTLEDLEGLLSHMHSEP
jgi:predicted acylesterase/phospholipase RssA